MLAVMDVGEQRSPKPKSSWQPCNGNRSTALHAMTFQSLPWHTGAARGDFCRRRGRSAAEGGPSLSDDSAVAPGRAPSPARPLPVMAGRGLETCKMPWSLRVARFTSTALSLYQVPGSVFEDTLSGRPRRIRSVWSKCTGSCCDSILLKKLHVL